MRRAGLVVAPVLAVALLGMAGRARAQDSSYGNVPEDETAHREDAPSHREVAPDEPEPSTEQPAAPSRTVLRLAAVGVYRRVFDVTFAGGGASFSYGGDYPMSGAFEMRIAGGRSVGGLGFADITALGTLTARLVGGLHLGIGAGLDILGIPRATTGDMMGGVGLASVGRVGYDFGSGKDGVFVDAEAAVMYTIEAVVWGPDIAVGYRF